MTSILSEHHEQPGSPPGPAQSPSRKAAQLYRAVWRWHFYAGLFVIPVLLVLATTGSIYLFKPQFEEWHYRALRTVTPPASAQALPLSQQIDAVRVTHPGSTIKAVVPPTSADRSTRVVLPGKEPGPFAPGFSVYVNPYTGAVLGHVDDGGTFMEKVRELHGELMAGAVGDRIVELVACWALVLVATGVYLWWRTRKSRMKRPGNGRSGRLRLRGIHSTTGVIASAVIVTLILTGLPWSGFWGDNFQRLTTGMGYAYPDESKYERSSSPPKESRDLSANAAVTVPWAAETLPVPQSVPPAAGHEGHDGTGGQAAPGSQAWQPGAIPVERAVRSAREAGLHGDEYSVILPDGPTGVYTVTSGSHADPGVERTVHIDQYSGQALVTFGWPEYGVIAKAVSQGIAIHEGHRFGPVNLMVMLAACLAVIALSITAVRMWWMRRPSGSGVGAPKRATGPKAKGAGMIAVMLALGVLFPLAGISMVAVLLADVLLVQRVGALRRIFG